LLPPTIVLDDPANPFFAHLFDPDDPERSHGTIGSKMQGKIGQMAASDERHLPANMVSYLLAQACGRDRCLGGTGSAL
jgi:hypothetical protein